MKIAFVNDSCERLGVEYISALLKSHGHQVELFIDPQLFADENISVKGLARLCDRRFRLIARLKDYAPDLIGMSVVTDFYPWACEMARLIKREMDVPVIFGGIHPTSVPERVINNDFVDMVCVGEGEYPMLELAESMSRGRMDYSIKNIWFKKDGEVIRNEVRPLVQDLDSLPFPDKGIFYSQGRHFSSCYYIMAGRGCRYSCSYCCHSFLRTLYKENAKDYLRLRSPDNVIEELKSAKEKYRIKHVRFFDESLAADKEWLKQFCGLYSKEVGLPFICYLHPRDVSPESVQCLKTAGCAEIEMGVQSMSEKISFGMLNRNVPNRMIERAIDIIKEEKISLVTDNIFGLPGQNEEDVLELARFYNRKRVSRIYFFWLRFYPGTRISEWAKSEGFISKEQYEMVMNGAGGRPFSRGGDTATAGAVKLQVLVFLMSLLPRRVIDRIIDSGMYRRLPGILPPAVLAMFTSLFSPALNDRLVHKKEILRYSGAAGGMFRDLFRLRRGGRETPGRKDAVLAEGKS